MQQYLSDDFINDPVRSGFNHQSNPLLPKNNGGYDFTNNIFIKELNNKGGELPIVPHKKTSDNDINTYNNDINRFNEMTQDMMEKDREISECKNKNTTINREIEALKQDFRKLPVLELENKQLQEKINNLTKDIYTKDIIIDKFKTLKELLKKEKEETKKLKKMIEISQKKTLYDESDSESDEEIDIEINMDSSDEEDTFIKTESEVSKLKKILVKRFPTNTRKQIDKLFIEMDINDDIKITKDLLKAIIDLLNV